MFAPVVFQELGINYVSFQLSWLRLVRTTHPPTGHGRVSGDFGASGGWKLHPQIMLSTSILECAETCGPVTVGQNKNYHSFFQSPLPNFRPPCCFILYPINTLSLSLHAGRREICSPCMVALRINPLFAANLGLSASWLAVLWQNKPSLATLALKKPTATEVTLCQFWA